MEMMSAEAGLKDRMGGLVCVAENGCDDPVYTIYAYLAISLSDWLESPAFRSEAPLAGGCAGMGYIIC